MHVLSWPILFSLASNAFETASIRGFAVRYGPRAHRKGTLQLTNKATNFSKLAAHPSTAPYINIASPEHRRDWHEYSLVNSRLTAPPRSTSSSQSLPYCRWFPAGLPPRTKHRSDSSSHKTSSPYPFECSSGNEPQSFGSGWASALQKR